MVFILLRRSVGESFQRCARHGYSSKRNSRRNLQHIDYSRQRHDSNNKLAFALVFGVAMIMGVGSAAVMAKCEKIQPKRSCSE
eukprot:scaffold3840_cov129-Cylindrotheca_fusiformis.AAC.6